MPHSTGSRPVTIVTGGSRGIGAAVAERLAADGHDLALTYRVASDEAAAVAAACRALGARVLLIRADLADLDDAAALVPATLEEYGRLTGLVNNAGVTMRIGDYLDIDLAEVERMLRINVLAPISLTRAALEVMSTLRGGEGGTIVNISSGAATSGAPNTYVPYAMSKAAINAMTIGLAKEFGPQGVRVNTVSPGTTYTTIHADGGRPDAPAERAPGIPLRRAAHPHEIADAVAYFFGPGAAFTSGANLRVTGGN
ncbi:NAD(P)-dependent dehydrogenase (short-subunit alcohol dehydrogenase family) [Microbacterium sp. AK009]|uniref:SDR family NAD(P)-dependent oxidoreductase n=1 Tax=Microbacterium sp. AK009 TaxID=2723068 RepID=UPI0015CAA411|nr:SDR family oxidoreductase [Microbacterium sp. AK009]NYF18240.1 NAD(P)-dependent dehydrogenase (short-subunit alcohol dehydrogenase family) [Microbacterium sp. AK009]